MSNLLDSVKWLDDSLDVGFKELNTIIDNKVYTIRKDLEDNIFSHVFGALDTLRSITGQALSAIEMIKNIPNKIANELQKILDKIMDQLMSFGFSGWVGQVVHGIKLISEDGVKDFLINSVAAGSVVLCANMDILKDLMEGYYVDPNILAGLFMSLSLDWMNRVCKDITHQEEMGMTNKEKIEAVYPYPGVEYKDEDAYCTFVAVSQFYFDPSNGPIPEEVGGMERAVMMRRLKEGKSAKEIRREMGDINSLEKKTYFTDMIDDINRELAEERLKTRSSAISKEELTALELRGDLYREDVTSTELIDRVRNYDTGIDALGSFIKNLADKDLSKVQKHKMNDTDKAILEKLSMLKEMSKTLDFRGRTHASGQFSNYDFEKVRELFTEEEQAYIAKQARSKYSHRYNGLHPTTEAFIEDNVYHVRKNDFDAVGV